MARALFVVAGFTLLLAGIAMLVLPGPALAVIPVALAILSLEFAWAAAPSRRARAGREGQADRQGDQPLPADRVAVATVLAIAAAIVASILWEIPSSPTPKRQLNRAWRFSGC